jgi:hypothetical protein
MLDWEVYEDRYFGMEELLRELAEEEAEEEEEG